MYLNTYLRQKSKFQRKVNKSKDIEEQNCPCIFVLIMSLDIKIENNTDDDIELNASSSENTLMKQ